MAEGSPLRANLRPPLAGERRRVTALFVDVVGFTALSERLDPELVTGVLNLLFRRVDAVVRRYDGYLDKFIGDAALILFGAPRAHEDDAERAVRVALELMAAMPDLAAEAEAALGVAVPLELHAGAATGLVVAGVIGAGEAARYTALGDPVNVAARLLDLAGPGEILVGPATEAALRGRAVVEGRGAVQLRGRQERVRTWAVRSIQREGVAARGLTGHSSGMVGRDGPLNALLDALDRANRGQGGLVTLTGEAGVGKSLLAREALSMGGLAVRAARCSSYGQAAPFHAIAELVSSLLRAPELAEGLDALDRAEGRPPSRREALDLLLGELGPEPAQAGQRAAALAALQDLTRMAARQRPQVLVVDDLHWADSSSLELLERLLELARELPVLLVLLSRPEGQPRLERLHQRAAALELAADHLRLEPLSPEHARALIHDLVGGPSALPAEVVDRLVRRSEGNPLFIEELIRQARARGALVWDGARWRHQPEAERAAEEGIPPTLYGLLATHLDRLPEDLRARVELASVVGVDVTPSLVDHALGEDPDAWERLVRATIFATGRDGQLRWVHPLLQEVVYGMLLRARRVALHRVIADALEAQEGATVGRAHALAWHLERSEQSGRAAEALAAAGRAAVASGAFREGLQLFERAVAEDPSMGDALASSRAWSLVRIGRVADGIQLVDGQIHRLEAEVQAGAPPWPLVEALSARAYFAYVAGDGPGICAYAERAVALAGEHAPPLVRATAWRGLGIGQEFRGRFAAARRSYQQVLDLVGADEQRGALDLVASVLNSLGEIARAEGYYDEALERYDRYRSVRAGLFSYNNQIVWALNSGAALVGARRWDEAEARLRGAIALLERSGAVGNLPEALVYLAIALAGLGARDEARRLNEQGLAVARAQGQEEMAALTLRVRGLLLALDGQPSEAIEALRESARLLRDAAKPIEEAQSRLALAAALEPLDPAAAVAERAAAAALFVETEQHHRLADPAPPDLLALALAPARG